MEAKQNQSEATIKEGRRWQRLRLPLFRLCGVAVKEWGGVGEGRQPDGVSSSILSSVFILSPVIKYLNSSVCLSVTGRRSSSVVHPSLCSCWHLASLSVGRHSDTWLYWSRLYQPTSVPPHPLCTFLSPTHFSSPAVSLYLSFPVVPFVSAAL